jgi:EpsI family protein
MNPTRRQALVVFAGMAGAAGLAALFKPRRRNDADTPRIDLDGMFPSRFGAWHVDAAMQAFVRPAAQQGKRYRIYDQVLERTFIDDRGRRVMLSVAFGGEQSASMQLHRPEVCYRASGYEVGDSQAAVLQLGDRPVPITRLKAVMPGRPEPITYWTVLGGAAVADDGSFQLRRLRFAAQRELLDGMLVRVSSIDPDAARAFALHQQFALALSQALAPADRDKILGRAGAG